MRQQVTNIDQEDDRKNTFKTPLLDMKLGRYALGTMKPYLQKNMRLSPYNPTVLSDKQPSEMKVFPQLRKRRGVVSKFAQKGAI